MPLIVALTLSAVSCKQIGNKEIGMKQTKSTGSDGNTTRKEI